MRQLIILQKSCLGVYKGCVAEKAYEKPIPKERSKPRAKDVLHLVHFDVCGLMEVSLLGGPRYFIASIDHFSNQVEVFAIKNKPETAKFYLIYEKMAEREAGNKIRQIRSDKGGEYMSNILQSYFEESGIQHQLMVSYTSHQNGVAERQNRTPLILVRSMLAGKSLGKNL